MMAPAERFASSLNVSLRTARRRGFKRSIVIDPAIEPCPSTSSGHPELVEG